MSNWVKFYPNHFSNPCFLSSICELWMGLFKLFISSTQDWVRISFSIDLTVNSKTDFTQQTGSDTGILYYKALHLKNINIMKGIGKKLIVVHSSNIPYVPLLLLILQHGFSLLMLLSSFSYVPELKICMTYINKRTHSTLH